MKPSDLFIRGRQFFGFLIPGIMWVASILLIQGEHPLAFVEGGNSFIRAALFIGISYIVGFIIQTLIFPLTADVLKKFIRQHPSKRLKELKKLKEQIVDIFKSRLPSDQKEWVVPPDDFRSFCKLYVLNHSPALGSLLLEKEDDINFLAANLLALPVFVFAWMYSHPYSQDTKVKIIIVLIVFALALLKRLYFYLQQETVYAYEACLMLLLKQPDQQANKVLGKGESIEAGLNSGE
jgi:hypothetical protein